jgi:hypothetical protein
MGSANLLTFPEAFDNAAWVRAALAGVNANVSFDPLQGRLVADKIVEDATAAVHSLAQTVVRGAVQKQQTFSAFFVSGERTTAVITLGDGTGAARVALNLAGGTVTGSGVTGSGVTLDGSGISANIVNGWRRAWVTATLPAATTNSICTIFPNTDSSYAGDGTSGLFAFGAQLENAVAPSNYLDLLAQGLRLGIGLQI